MSRLRDHTQIDTLHPSTAELINREKARQKQYERRSTSRTRPEPHHQHSVGMMTKWRQATKTALRWSRAHYRDHIHVTQREHMSAVDHFDGKSLRRGDVGASKEAGKDGDEEEVAVIHPLVDGRLKDEGRK